MIKAKKVFNLFDKHHATAGKENYDVTSSASVCKCMCAHLYDDMIVNTVPTCIYLCISVCLSVYVRVRMCVFVHVRA